MAEASTKRNRNLPQQLTLDHVSPATRLLEKRRQMFEVQEALDAQKEEFQRREATFKRREEMLKKKDLELQESLIKFNKFLQENDSKRSRAEKKEKEEVKQRLLKEQEITKLQEALMQQKEQRRVMTIELDKMMKHQHFLESVLEHTEEFPEITDMLSRYETLDAAHSDLISRQVQAEEHNEAERHELTQFVRDKTDEILVRHAPFATCSLHPPHPPPPGFTRRRAHPRSFADTRGSTAHPWQNANNTIAELQKLQELKISQTREGESQSDRRLQDVSERTLQLGQVMMACDNIYHRCSTFNPDVQRSRGDYLAKASKGEHVDDETEVVIDKLSFICAFITDYASIIKTLSARRAEKEAMQGTQAQRKDGEGVGESTVAGDGSADLSKSRAPKSVAPTSVAPASVAPKEGSASQSLVMGSAAKSSTFSNE